MHGTHHHKHHQRADRNTQNETHALLLYLFYDALYYFTKYCSRYLLLQNQTEPTAASPRSFDSSHSY